MAAMEQAQADVETAKQRAAGGGGPISALDTWNRELMNVSIEQAERRARLQYIDGRLDKYRQVSPALSEMDLAAQELRAADSRLARQRDILEGMRTDLRGFEATQSAPTTGPAKP